MNDLIKIIKTSYSVDYIRLGLAGYSRPAVGNHASTENTLLHVSGNLSVADNGENSKYNQRAEENTLVGVHNLSADNLRHVLKMGGLANPSMGIVDITKQAIEGYGEITLIAPTPLIDKSTGRNAGTYAADIYSPRYPSITKTLDKKSFGMLEDKLRGILGKDNVYSIANMIAENVDRLKGYSGLYQVFVADKYGIENAPNVETARNYVYDNKLGKEFNNYTDHFLDDIPLKEEIFNGYTPSGKRKYLPHTLDNVSKYTLTMLQIWSIIQRHN